MVTQDAVILLCIICAFIAFFIGYFSGRCYRLDEHDDIKDTKLKLIEGIDGVTSVQLAPIRYVELLKKEEEYNELKLKLKDI